MDDSAWMSVQVSAIWIRLAADQKSTSEYRRQSQSVDRMKSKKRRFPGVRLSSSDSEACVRIIAPILGNLREKASQMHRSTLSGLVLSQLDELGVTKMVRVRKSICATNSGRTQSHSFIFSAVIVSPHRAFRVSGKFVKGHSSIFSPRNR